MNTSDTLDSLNNDHSKCYLKCRILTQKHFLIILSLLLTHTEYISCMCICIICSFNYYHGHSVTIIVIISFKSFTYVLVSIAWVLIGCKHKWTSMICL